MVTYSLFFAGGQAGKLSVSKRNSWLCSAVYRTCLLERHATILRFPYLKYTKSHKKTPHGRYGQDWAGMAGQMALGAVVFNTDLCSNENL
jgi:hypothetical protein